MQDDGAKCWISVDRVHVVVDGFACWDARRCSSLSSALSTSRVDVAVVTFHYFLRLPFVWLNKSAADPFVDPRPAPKTRECVVSLGWTRILFFFFSLFALVISTLQKTFYK